VSRIQDWQVKLQTHLPVWQGLVPPLAYPFYIFGQLFSDLASADTGLLASLATVLKKTIHISVTAFVSAASHS
jgi:hypothetical protein